MKNIKTSGIGLVVLAVALLSVSTGCKKQLETKVYSQLTPQNFYRSEGDANAALITLYIPFTSNWGNPDPGNGTWYASLYNADLKTYLMRSLLTTDELSNDGGGSNAGALVSFNWTPSTWTGANDPNYAKISYVAKATEVIEAIQNSAAVSDAVKKSYAAQAKALRAWLMYVLFDFYGPVNVKTEYASLTDTSATPRPSAADYVAKMETDLLEVMPDLADKYNNDASNWGRVSKGAARALLLRIYMHTKQWGKAEAMAREIMQMGYGLLTGPTGYKNVFISTNERNNEVIYAVPVNDGSPNFWAQEVLPGDFKSAAGIDARNVGWNENYMSWAFYDTYEPTDVRRNTTIIDAYTRQNNSVANRANGLRGAIPIEVYCAYAYRTRAAS
jgi:hypothetical protein